MKYGIVTVQHTRNIGDDIQSYAAMRFLPHVDYFIERENMDAFVSDDGEPVSTIMNGWFMYNKLCWPISYYINPLYVSMHFHQTDSLKVQQSFLQGFGKKDLIEHEPIGCRDLETMSYLEENQIQAYFSGCLTLTLEIEKDVEHNEKLFLVDLPDQLREDLARKALALGIEVETVEHENADRSGMTWDERFKETEKLLCAYKGARAVITTRLHCALPCLALGTPVLLIDDPDIVENNRFSGLKQYLHVCSEAELRNSTYEYSIKHPPRNSEAWRPLKNSLESTIRTWVQWSEEHEADLQHRTKLQASTLSERLAWKNTCLEGMIKRLEAEWTESHQWMETQARQLQELQDTVSRDEYGKLAEKYQQLDHRLYEIVNSSSWKAGRAITFIPRKLKTLLFNRGKGN